MDGMKEPMPGTLASSIARAWVATTQTPIVAVPAVPAALVWFVVIFSIRDVATAPQDVIYVAFAIVYLAGASVIAATAALAYRRLHGERIRYDRQLVRRSVAGVCTLSVLGATGPFLVATLHSFVAAWFVGTFLFAYAVPLVVGEGRNWFVSIFASAFFAVRHARATIVSAAVATALGTVALAVGDVVSAVPDISILFQVLLMQFTLGFVSVFLVDRFVAARRKERRDASTDAPTGSRPIATVDNPIHLPG
jgi:hypothetical protein